MRAAQTQEIYGQQFKGLYGFEQAEADISGCSFAECDFTEVHFSGILESCSFTDCNLSLASFEGAKLQDVKFSGCKLEGVDFTRVNALGLAIGFERCLIRNCNFSFVELKGTSFRECEIADTDFIGSKLKESSFAKAVFRNVTFHETDLVKADFTEATGYLINPLTCMVKGAKFSLPDAVSLLECMGIKLN
jgi:fluoroquinolone resistance protein